MTARYLDVGEVGPVWAQRISYAGELGWELYGQFAMRRSPVGSWCGTRARPRPGRGRAGAFDTLRLEKGYRLWGQDIHTEHDPFEAGLGFAVKMDKGAFQGREALAAALERGSAERLAVRHARRPERGRAAARSRSGPRGAWSATRRPPGYGYSVGRCIVYGYLPAELAVPGTPVEVEYFDERLPATVRRGPAVGPEGERLRA